MNDLSTAARTEALSGGTVVGRTEAVMSGEELVGRTEWQAVVATENDAPLPGHLVEHLTDFVKDYCERPVPPILPIRKALTSDLQFRSSMKLWAIRATTRVSPDLFFQSSMASEEDEVFHRNFPLVDAESDWMQELLEHIIQNVYLP